MNNDLTLKTIKFMPLLFLTTLIVSCLGFRFRVLDELSLFWPANMLVFCLMISFRARKGTIKGKTFSIGMGFLVGYAAMLSAALLMDNNSPLKTKVLLCLCNIIFVVAAWCAFYLMCRFTGKWSTFEKFSKYYVYIIFASTFVGAFSSGVAYGFYAYVYDVGNHYDEFMDWFSEQLGTGIILAFFFLRGKDILRALRNIPLCPKHIRENIFPFLVFIIFLLVSLFFLDASLITLSVIPLTLCAFNYSFPIMSLLCAITGVILNYLYINQVGILIDSNSEAYINSFLTTARLNIAMLIMAMLSVSHFVSMNRRLIKIIESNSLRDALTNTFNRRAFLSMLNVRQGVLMNKRKRQITLLFLDIDYFKQVNDTYGHACGDELIASFARMLSANIRPSDILCRWGGEEFIIAAYDLTDEQSEAMAEALRRLTESTPLMLSDGREIYFTVSIGVAIFSQYEGGNIYDLIGLADEQLYKAKAQGRNCVCMRLAEGV
ncbi:GGDEF domain-containing protein [Pectobacterium atrosepticum]|uniref:GGDEF domain-containing protein n=1 Tax=Pectobacterium atrosepticum TaxID=29471 RepID=UPI00049B4118|nr:GGDEF domain-containing protein [Pectobacterium atrosepticum]AIA69557.1 diguanylate cyclase [Pectobacterium atrosepticum]ATY92975.1 GGDEF domain-containing protein [Pectobacterium atrosepticum]KFX15597.1 diguanylate cyclase [Pectobacterium atrosepticum]KFX24069.1 diguanylate cyclase [Pectobacterium atrosepticum]MBL0894728.1 GGDEF domain-containing protein [Pectobacterium atrosepticum]